MAYDVKINIEVTGTEEEIMEFAALCTKIEVLGVIGACRSIPLVVDGDGSARLRFNIQSEVAGRGMVNLVDEWREKNYPAFLKQVNNDKLDNHWIGG